MTTYPAILWPDDESVIFLPAVHKTITLSGTVKSTTGTGLIRKVLVYKKTESSIINEADNFDLHSSTISASDGSWSIDVYGGSNDEYRVIAIGLDGENSAIYEHIVEG